MNEEPSVAARLARAVTFRTVSYGPEHRADLHELKSLYAFLREAFPRVHKSLKLTFPGDHAMLYQWPGSNPALAAALFVAHTDVVPADKGREGERPWTYPPFEGRIADGWVWGRGTLDAVGGVLPIVHRGSLRQAGRVMADTQCGLRIAKRAFLTAFLILLATSCISPTPCCSSP
jgi:acetylornithine deacetylase/succinyl-diaminopimelate desuccinylase-like protein